MHTLIALAVTFSVLLGTSCYGADSLYTWKDDKGTLNITDAPPPQGAEILDISPIIRQTPPDAADLTPKKEEKKTIAQPMPGPQAVSKEKKQVLAEAAKYRKQEADGKKEGEEITAEIEAWQAKMGTKRKRRRNNRQIKEFNEQVAVINQKVNTAAKKAYALEKKAAGMQ